MSKINNTFYITGIDTNCGKTLITGLLAKELCKYSLSVITQKLVQTGNHGVISEDIETHRKIMNVELFEEDKNFTTCKYVFPFPASPHLSAQLTNSVINFDLLKENTALLEKKYNVVLLEGAGGLMSPISKEKNQLEYIIENEYPVIFITSSKLGSINQTLLNFEVLKKYNCKVISVIYNIFKDTDKLIIEDTYNYLNKRISRYFPSVMIDICKGNAIDKENIMFQTTIYSILQNMPNSQKFS